MRIVVSTFLTLDGVMQAPGGSEEDRRAGFEHGGWQEPYFDDAAGEAVVAGFAEADGLLLGRWTYDLFAEFWPTSTDPFAERMNNIRKYVVSTTLKEPLEWSNSTLVEGGAEGVANLKERPGGDVLVIGSAALTQSLMQLGLVDEYRLMIHPVVLGSGRRLFEPGIPKTPLKLAGTMATEAGILFVTYHPADE
jgi:dihydrofolate reductase